MDTLTAPKFEEYFPVEHELQTETLDAPVDAEYVPAVQGVHTLTPVSEYVPAPHCWHAAEVDIPVPVL